MATKQWYLQQFVKNDIFKPKYFLPINKYMNSVYVVLIQNLCVCFFFSKTNKYSITESISDFCNHGNQIKHGNQTMEPSAILQKKKMTFSNHNIS